VKVWIFKGEVLNAYEVFVGDSKKKAEPAQ
jgi:hypothetical protein